MATKTITGVGVGTTTITATFGGQSSTVNFTVSKATGSVTTVPTALNPVYGSTSALCTAGAGTGTMMYRLGSSGNFSSSIPTANGLNAGSYTVYYYAAESTNYTASSTGNITVTVGQANGGVNIANANPTYGTSGNLASVSGNTGTMYYRLGTSGSFSTTMPTASGLNAGSYTLYYYVAASTNYTAYGSSSYPKSLSVSVAQAGGRVTTAPANNAATYGSGSYLCTTGAGTGTMMYKLGSGSYSSTRPTTSGLNVGSYTLYYYAAASTNYTASGEGSITVTVVQAGGGVTISNANPTYGTSNAIASVSGATGTVYYRLGTSGSFSTTMPTATSSVNAGSYTLYYYVASSTNYTEYGNSSSPKSLSVSVAQAAGSVKTAPTNNAATYGSGSYLCTSGASDTGTMQYKLGTGSYSSTRPTTSGLNVGSYTLYYKAAASTNYTASSEGSITVTVVQAGGGVTISNANPTYGTSNNLASVSGATGTMHYKLDSGSWTTTMPTASGLNAGSYTLYYYVDASTNYTAFGSSSSPKSLTVTVAKAAGSVKTAPTNSAATYGSGSYLCTTGASDTGTMQYKLGSGSYSSTRPTTSGLNAGSYTLYYYAAASTNYNASGEGSITVTVVQAGGGVTISNANPTYGTSNAIASVSGNTGTMHYKLDSGSWTTTMPTATTSVGGGSHTLYYYVDASTNYTAYGSSGSPKSLTVTVAKANQSAPSVGTPTAITYGSGTLTGSYSGGGGQGSLYYKVDTNGGTNYGTATSSAPTRSSAGTTTYIAYWSGNDNYNASPNSSQGKLVVNKANPTMSLSNTDVTFHNTASIKATASVAGTVYWGTTSSTSGMTNTKSVSANTQTELTTRTNLGSTTVYAYFVPTDTSNYNSLGNSGDDYTSKTMTVSQASDATVSVTTAANADTYESATTLVTATNSSSHGASAAYVGYKLGEATADNQITWVAVGNALSLGASAAPGKYYIYKKWTADSNHSNSSGYTSVGSLTRSQASDASVSVTTAANAGTYGSSTTLVAAANSSSHGTSAAYVGYKLGEATADNQITWVAVGNALSLGTTANAGTYYIYKKWTADSNHSNSANYTQVSTLTRSQASGGVNISNANPTYGTSNALASVSGNTGTMYYRLGTSGSFSTTMPTASGLNAGSYTLYYYVASSTNYTAFGSSSSPKSLTVSVAKAAGSVTTAPTASNPVYGSGNNLCTAGTGTGTMMYRVGTSGSFSSTIPTTSGLNAGSYTLYYYAAESTNYTASSTGSITVTVAKAGISPTVSMSGYTYAGTKSTPSVSGNSGGGTVTYYYNTTNSNSNGTAWSNVTSSTSLTAGDYWMYATVGSTTNYNGATTPAVKFTISKAAGTGSVEMTGWSYGGTVTDPSPSSSTNGTGSVSYTWYNSSKTALSSKPTSTSTPGTYYVKATFAATNNYTAYTTDYKSFTISQRTGAAPTFAASPVSATCVQAGTAVNAGAFTAATAGHSGSITYSIQGVVKDGTSTQLTGWTMTSTTSRVITVPASTAPATYLVTVRATEAQTTTDTSSYKDAVITVTLSKGTQTLNLDKTELSLTVPNTGTITASGYAGTLSVSSGSTGVATASNAAASTITAVSAGTATITFTAAATTYVNAVSKTATVTVSRRTGAAPTFNNSSVTATCSQDQTAKTTSAFTAATAGHSGTLSYSLVSAKNSGGTSLSNWSVNSSNRTIGIPANTVSGTYTVVVRATEAQTSTDSSSTKDATITVTLSKGTQSLTLTGNPTNCTSTYPNGGTITASGHAGTISASSATTGVATVTTSGSVVTVAAVKQGTSVITVTAAANDYVESVSATKTWIVNRRNGTAPTFSASSVTATCVQSGAAVNAGAFTAATAKHSGSITYSIQGVVKDGTSTQLTGWTMTSTTSRVITVPASTLPATYKVTVRATEGQTDYDTSSYTDAVITVTLNKGTQSLTLTSSPTNSTTTYPTGGTITASGHAGTISTSSATTSVATVSASSSTVTVTAVGQGTSVITVTAAATDYVNAVSKTVTWTVNRRTGAAPTFNASSVTATCVQAGSAVNTGAFTAATAGHGGTLSYSIVSVVEDGSSTALSGWTMTSSSRVITVPAGTVGGKTYLVTVRATEAQTSTDSSSTKDAVITVTLNKGSQTLNLDKTALTVTVGGSTGTITASGYAGTLNVTSGTPAVATASNAAASTITAVKAGTSTITFTAAATNYVNAVSKTATVTVNRRTGAAPTFANSTVTATCVQAQSSRTTSAFTAATAGHSGSITYSLVSAKNSGGTSLSGWSVNNDNRTIGIPANTVSSTYTVVVRATEAQTDYDTSSTADATIIVTLNKGTQSLTLTSSPTNATTSYPTGGTITASGHVGTISASSATTTVATSSVSGSTVTVTAAGQGTSVITVTAAANDYVESVSKTVTWTINRRTGAAPTFNASSVTATCVQAGTAVNTGAFTAATAGHGGSITYAIQSVVEDGSSTALSGWTMTSTTSRVITVPASTVGGKTYLVTVRATEAATSTDTSSTKDAVITVTLNKGSQTLNLSKTTSTVTVGGSTDTITASGYSGTLTVTSGTPAVATASNEASSTITAVKAGTSTITFTAAATNYVNAVSKTATVTVNRRTGSAPTFNNSSVTATCSQDQTAKITSAFTAGTATHSGALSYSLVSAKNSGGSTLSGWSVNSSNRTIGIPADTVSGTYTVVVRCTEAQTDYDTSSTKDATITVTLGKGTQSLTLTSSPANATTTYPTGGTITASGHVGTISTSSGTSSVATVTASGSTVTVAAVGQGTSVITVTAAATDYVDSVSKTVTWTINRRTGAAPTFADGTVTATCSQDQTAKTTSAFTAGTAKHGGALSYSLVSAKNSGGSTLSGWSVTSSTRKINIPANTIAGTYTCVVRCTEGQTSTDSSSTTDATITVTLSKGSQSLTLTGNPTNYTSTYNNGGTITASGHVGTISASSGTQSVATVSVSGSTVTVNCVGAGTSVITVTAAGNDYVNSVSKTATWTINKADATLPTNWKGDSKVFHQTATLTAEGYSGGTLRYRYDENGGTTWTETTTAPTRTAIGTTTVQCKVVGDANHNDTAWKEPSVTLTIREASDAHMEVITYDRTYNTNNQVIATQDTRSGHTAEGIGTYYLGYYKSDSAATQESQITWGSANSSLSAKYAGTYQIYYKFTPDGNHDNSVDWSNDVNHGYVASVTISKASRSGEVTCSDTTYPGTVQASVSGNTENGTVTWGINPGTGTATISNSGLVTPTSAGTVTVTASVEETDNYLAYVATPKEITIGKISLESIGKPDNVVYTGSAFTPTPAVTATVGGVSTTLTLNTDYTLSYSNNTNVGTATVTATGIGNFTGTVSETWNITGATITVTANNQSYTYDGNFHGTGVSVTTVNNQSYEVKYRTTNSGEYNLTSYPIFRDVVNSGYSGVVYYQVTADNHITYTGSYQLEITPLTAVLSWGITSWMYDGNTHSTTCTVTNLVGADICDVTLSNNSITNAGDSVLVTATGLSNSNYSLPSSDLTRTLTITAGIFVKVSGQWKPIKQVYKKVSGQWTEQNVNTVFDTSKAYKKLN